MIGILLSSFAIMLASLSGKVLLWRSAGAFIERNLHLMVTFAAGVFAVFAWQLGVEVLEHMEPLVALAWVVAGAIGITILCRWLPHGHEVHEKDAEHHHEHEHVDAHRMLISDSVHNAGDGILLAASFSIAPSIGFVAALSVLIHEVVQETAEFFVLRDSGYSVRRALLLNFATSAFVLVGGIGGFVLLGLFEILEGPLLAIAMGGVVSVVLFDLLPNSVRDARSRALFTRHAAWFVLGCVLMYGVSILVPHQDPDHAEARTSNNVLLS